MREKVHGRTPSCSAIQLRRTPRRVISRVSGTTDYSGFGGMGIFTLPLAYPGWSAAQKAAGAPYTDQLTPCQVAAAGKNAC